jgi:hypothetical protein
MTSQHVRIIVPTKLERLDHLRSCISSILKLGLKIVAVVPRESTFIPDLLISPDIDVIKQNAPGLVNAINQGIEYLPDEVEFFSWLGDDDLLSNSFLEYGINHLLMDTLCVMTYGRCRYIDSKGNLIWINKSGNYAKWILAFGPNLIPQPGSLFRVSAVKKVGMLDNRYQNSFDHDLYLKLKKVGRMKFFPHEFSSFRWHAGSLSVIDRKISCLESKKIRLASKKNFIYFLIQSFIEPLIFLIVYHAPKFLFKK